MTGMVTYLDGFFPPDRDSGLLPVLRLMGLHTLADDIVKGLDTRVGESTFGRLLNVYRDKLIAHPQFTLSAIGKAAKEWREHMPTSSEGELFRQCAFEVFSSTAACYAQFAERNPEFVARYEAKLPEMLRTPDR
jgi:hypothetical protein